MYLTNAAPAGWPDLPVRTTGWPRIHHPLNYRIWGRRQDRPMGEIAITPAMEQAGAEMILEIFECALSLTAPSDARRIFQAMLDAQDGVSGEAIRQS